MATNTTTCKLSPADEIIGNDNTSSSGSSGRGLLSLSHRQNSLQSLHDGIESLSDEFDTSTGTTGAEAGRSKISSETNNNNVDWDALFEDYDEPEAISDPAGVAVGGSSSCITREEDGDAAKSTLLSSSMGVSLPITTTRGRGKVISLTSTIPTEPNRASTTISRTTDSTSCYPPRRTTAMEDMEMEVRRIYQNKALLSSPQQAKKDITEPSPVSSLIPHLPGTSTMMMMTKSLKVEQPSRISSLLNDPFQDTTPTTSNNNNRCTRKDIKKYSAMMERTRRPLPPGGHELREVRAKTIAHQSKDEETALTLGAQAAVLPPLEPPTAAFPALPFPVVRCITSSSSKRTDVMQPPPSPPSLLSHQQQQQSQYHLNNPQSPNDIQTSKRELYYNGRGHYHHGGDYHLRTQGTSSSSRAYAHQHPTEHHHPFGQRIVHPQEQHHQEGQVHNHYYHHEEADCRNRDPYRDRDTTTGGAHYHHREGQAFVSPMMAVAQGISSRDGNHRDVIASPRPEEDAEYNRQHSYYSHSSGRGNDSSTTPPHYHRSPYENGYPFKTRPEPLPRERDSSSTYHPSNYYHDEHMSKKNNQRLASPSSWAAEPKRSYYQDASPPPAGYTAPASPASKKARRVTTTNHRRPWFHQASSDELKGLLEPILVPPSSDKNDPPLQLPPTKCIEICQPDGTKRKYQMMYTALKVPRDMAPAYMKQMKLATERLLQMNNNKTTNTEPSPVMSSTSCHKNVLSSSPSLPQS